MGLSSMDKFSSVVDIMHTKLEANLLTLCESRPKSLKGSNAGVL
jgi:hypothetical protein